MGVTVKKCHTIMSGNDCWNSVYFIKSRSSLLAWAHSGGPVKRAVKRLWCVGVYIAKKHSASLTGGHIHVVAVARCRIIVVRI